jgi:SAM-dependent methyltransferase
MALYQLRRARRVTRLSVVLKAAGGSGEGFLRQYGRDIVRIQTEGDNMTVANDQQAAWWSQIAPKWLELDDQLALEVLGALPAKLAMDRLNVSPGQRVLDIGCGTGRTTLELAALVGPAGAVVGVDISAALLASGRAAAARLSIENVEFMRGDVQVSDLGDSQFDAAYSRFGVMFFADPAAAFANVRDALRPGAVLSFACWGSVLENDWVMVPVAAVAQVTGSLPPMPGPGEPGSFSLADPDRIREILGNAGFGHIEVTPHADQIAISEEGITDFAGIALELVRFAGALADAETETRAQALAAIDQGLHARLQAGQVLLSRSVHLVTARS